MITALSIQNFKGLSNITLEDMRPGVLIVGKNNSGKSSILEAIFLLMACTTPEVFLKLNSFRSKDEINGTEDLWGKLFGKAGQELSIAAETEDKATIELHASHTPDGNAFYSEDAKSGSGALLGNGVLSGPWRPDTVCSYTVTHGQASEEGSYVAEAQGIRKTGRTISGQAKLVPVRFVPASRSGLAMSVLLGEVELRNQKQRLLEALSVVDSTIEDLVTVTQPTGTEVYVRSASGLLPLAYAGDGLRSVAALVMQTLLHGAGGIVLVDEIENGIHYSLYGKIWEILTKTAASQGAQIIATTYSYEFVSGAFEAAKASHVAEQFSLYRIDRDNRRQVVRYSPDEMDAALRYSMEVR